MRNTSLRDLKLADLLSHLTEVEIINPKNDELVKSVLQQIGYDTRQPIEYTVSNHRDMQGKSAVGFQVIGEYNTDPKYKHFLDTVDRVVVAGLTDIHLARDMETLLGKRFIYRNEDETENKTRENDPRYYTPEQLAEMGFTGMEQDDEDYSEGVVDSDYDMITSQIMALEAIKKSLRG